MKSRHLILTSVVLTLLLVMALPTALAQSSTTYVVQGGDTLASIAARTNVSLNALMSANGITNANIIFAGQVLTIPGSNFGTGGPLTTSNVTVAPAVTTVPTP